MSYTQITIKDKQTMKTLAHPVATRIIRVMSHIPAPMTVKMIAMQLKEKHGNIYYHVQKLHDVGLLELVKTEMINGITAKYYLRKYDMIYYKFKGKDEEEARYLGKYTQSIFKSGIITLLEEMRPSDKFISDLDVGKDAYYGSYYHFDPDEIEDLNNELIRVLNKYKKKENNGTKYVGFFAIGKYRKDTALKSIEEIKKDYGLL